MCAAHRFDLGGNGVLRIPYLEKPSMTRAPATQINVDIADLQASLRVDPEALVDLVTRTLVYHNFHHAIISITLLDDPAIRALNAAHLGHDYETDVITFPLSEPGEIPLEAELLVSAEMALRTAEQSGVEPMDELALYIVHGLLHLAGEDDRDEASAASMRRREGEVLARLGRPNPYAAAGRGGGP